MDARIERTHETLVASFIKLMAEKGFDNLRVADLTDRAGCNRGTFYLHYKDKYDLLAQMEDELLQGLIARARPFSPQRLRAKPTVDEPEPAVVDVFRYMDEHAAAFRVLLGPKGDPAFLSRLKALMRQNVYDQLAWFQAQGTQTPVPHDFLTAYLSSAHIGVIQHWLETGMKSSPEHMAVLMTRIARFWASAAGS
jgi:AcrR family transcriptional regulator